MLYLTRAAIIVAAWAYGSRGFRLGLDFGLEQRAESDDSRLMLASWSPLQIDTRGISRRVLPLERRQCTDAPCTEFYGCPCSPSRTSCCFDRVGCCVVGTQYCVGNGFCCPTGRTCAGAKVCPTDPLKIQCAVDVGCCYPGQLCLLDASGDLSCIGTPNIPTTTRTTNTTTRTRTTSDETSYTIPTYTETTLTESRTTTEPPDEEETELPDPEFPDFDTTTSTSTTRSQAGSQVPFLPPLEAASRLDISSVAIAAVVALLLLPGLL